MITHLPLAGGDFGTADEREAVLDLESRIERAAAALGGDHDGNAFGDGEVVLYSYGPDADALFAAIERALEGFSVQPGAYAIKRYGRADDPHVVEERVPLA